MDVIGVGLGRTGTNSLKLALEELGCGPCYHMKEMVDRPDRLGAWRRILDGAPADWDEMYRGFNSTMDWPGNVYWRELADAYPEAKVILSVRDPDQWIDSMFKTILRWPLLRRSRLDRWTYGFFLVLNPRSAAVPRMLDKVLNRLFEGHVFGRPDDREVAIETFLRHSEEIKAYVAADRLLVYQVSEGWEPLCAFLGVPVPQTPFPRVNDAKEFQRDIAARRNKSALQVLTAGAAVMAIALGIAAVTNLWP